MKYWLFGDETHAHHGTWTRRSGAGFKSFQGIYETVEEAKLAWSKLYDGDNCPRGDFVDGHILGVEDEKPVSLWAHIENWLEHKVYWHGPLLYESLNSIDAIKAAENEGYPMSWEKIIWRWQQE